MMPTLILKFRFIRERAEVSKEVSFEKQFKTDSQSYPSLILCWYGGR
jgi:hypothetical protein